jgi:flagellar hook-associated protein 2
LATTPTLSSPGIGSGLDVNGIVDKLMAVEQRPLTVLAQRQATDQAKISAFGNLNSALSALQAKLAALATPSGFQTLGASIADVNVLSASIGGKAVAGAYDIEVTSLAQAQKLVSAGYAGTADAVGSGTLTFEFGTTAAGVFTPGASGAKTVTIAPGQDTLAGIRDAVNAAAVGVTATIVNDGSALGNRLVFTSNATGAANSLRVGVTDADATNGDAAGLSALAYDPAGPAGAGRNRDEKVIAKDAALTIDGIPVTKPSNVITDAIDGVTLTLKATNAGTPTRLSVSSSTANVAGSISAFAKAYNDLDTTFDNLTKYDATQKQASVLTGDATVRTIQFQLRSVLGSAFGTGTYRTLSQVGVSFQTDGTLAVDSTKLQAALDKDPAGVTQLFAAVASASDARVTTPTFGAATQPGTYAVNVTQLATQGRLAGAGAAGLTITAGVNDRLDVVVDGVSASVTLAAGTYADAAALSREVQARINGASALTGAGSAVAVSESAGVISIASARYGSASTVAVNGNGASSLLGGAPVATAGVDVAGTIGGVAATGAGQVLRGQSGSATEGLSITIAGGATGARGSVSLSRGLASRLGDLLSGVLGSSGVVASQTKSLQKDIEAANKQADVVNQRLTLIEANYRAKFNALDSMLSSLSAQSNALTQALAALPRIDNGGN